LDLLLLLFNQQFFLVKFQELLRIELCLAGSFHLNLQFDLSGLGLPNPKLDAFDLSFLFSLKVIHVHAVVLVVHRP